MRIFGVGGALIGLAGSLHAFYYRYIDPTQFSSVVIAYAFIAVIAGGRGAHLGTIFGTLFVMVLLEGSRFVGGPHSGSRFGSGCGHPHHPDRCRLIALLIYRPRGFMREYRLKVPLEESGREPLPYSPKEALP